MSEVGAVAQERYDDVVAGRRGPGSVGRIAAGVEVKIRHLDDDRPTARARSSCAPTRRRASSSVASVSRSTTTAGSRPVTSAACDDDILYITGRVQEKIIVGGFNVYPAEVEDVARRSALVSDAVVVGLPDERLGEIPVAGIVWAEARDDDSAPRGAAGRPRALQGASRALRARRRPAHATRQGRPPTAPPSSPDPNRVSSAHSTPDDQPRRGRRLRPTLQRHGLQDPRKHWRQGEHSSALER